MKKGLRKYAILLLCLLLTWGLLPSAVWAESNASRLPDVVSEPREDTILIDVFGDFETMGADNIIRLLNVYRYQACYYGDWDPRNTSRKLALSDYSGGEDPSDAVLAKPNGDYVPAAWSADLERCAEIRAVEASIYWAHTRPNGYSCFTVNSSIMNNENLAWNFSMLGGIQAWYEERADWVNHGSGQTGHYTNIINPNIIRFGIAAFMNPNISTYYDADYVTVAMSGSMQALSINGAINRSGRYVQRIEIQNGAVGNVSLETQESIQVGQTQTVVANAEMSLAGVWTVQSIAPIAKNVLWNSSDPSILSVDGNGKVKGQKAGTAVITASTAGKQASCTITVTGTQYRIISFNPNGGTVSPTTKTVTYGQAYGTLPTPTRSGYTFDGWYTAKTGGKKVTASTVCYATGDYTLYARWTSVRTYTVTLNPNGGTCGTGSKTVTYGQAYGTMPVPTRKGYTFAGWWTAKTGGKKVTASTICYASGNYTLYARWTEGYTMTFNPNGGTVSPTTKVVKYGQQYGSLPTPTRAGYTFAG
ncbi:MAG: InlB B-repeat-containing protein, partial [Clostridia bacterium]|nr:InlB B-repeat-containing protein [Clostridia bacterium]